MKITFLGGVGTVTGSKYLLEADTKRILVDCGLFQGQKPLRLRNWAPFPVDPKTIDAVILSHAHLDHTGYFPLLIKNGFKGPAYATSGTMDLCAILFPDSGYLNEREAEFLNRHKFSKHNPALPLYTKDEAVQALKNFSPFEFHQTKLIGQNLAVTFLPAGHILGAALVSIEWFGKKILFSGDLGRPNSATMVDPTPVREADYLVVESTYGNRKHGHEDVEEILAGIITTTIGRGGTIIIPAFAVGRTQSLFFHIYRLKREGKIPSDLPIFLDSPMAVNASAIFCSHLGEHRLLEKECLAMCDMVHYVGDVAESKALVSNEFPKIIVSASGMVTGGRVVHHLKHFLPDWRNTVILVGFQARGTRGAALRDGAKKVKIHGQEIPVKADIHSLDMLSAHADADEILAWLGYFAKPPAMTFITHGEPNASEALRTRIGGELGWPCQIPEYKQSEMLK